MLNDSQYDYGWLLWKQIISLCFSKNVAYWIDR